jgi:uncharacterized repeat protein (TIGR01451 family)
MFKQYQKHGVMVLPVLVGLLAVGVLALFMVQTSPVTAATQSASPFVNGGFEAENFNGWAKTTFLNPGLTLPEPFTGTSIVRNPGGVDQSVIFTATTPMSLSDPNTGDVLRYPRFGHATARVNGPILNQVSNSIAQTITVTTADIDPRDGKIHIRFAYAPVLQDPEHNPQEQPFFYVGLRNVTKGALLYEKFVFSGQPGVPWQVNGDVKFLDWQIVDMSFTNAELTPGSQVSLEVLAAGCSLSAHYGYVNVDEFGTYLPSLNISKTADKASVVPGGNLTFTLRYENNAGLDVSHVVVTETLPVNTTFVSAQAPCGYTAGVVSCPLGTVTSGYSGTLQIAVQVLPTATGSVDNGNYQIAGDGYAPLLGPLVSVPIVANPLPKQADLSVNKTYTQALSNLTFIVTVQNAGPDAANGVIVSDTMPLHYTGVTWVCVSSGGSLCTASGSGNIYDTVNLPSGSKVIYTTKGSLPYFLAQVFNTAELILPDGLQDTHPENNKIAISNGYRVLLPVVFSIGR